MRTLKPLLPIVLLIVVGAYLGLHRSDPAIPPRPASTIAAAQTSPAPAAKEPSRPAHAEPPFGLPAYLPPQARDILALIAHSGPFPHHQDGAVFGNYEGLLPHESHGYYREYTVDTPGLGYRGARRIITGGHPPVVYYYTEDHYRSFRAFRLRPELTPP